MAKPMKKKNKKIVNTQESTVFKSNIFSFCGNSGSKHKCIMEVTKNPEENTKKYNKKCQKLKIKTLFFYFTPFCNALSHSPWRRYSRGFPLIFFRFPPYAQPFFTSLQSIRKPPSRLTLTLIQHEESAFLTSVHRKRENYSHKYIHI